MLASYSIKLSRLLRLLLLDHSRDEYNAKFAHLVRSYFLRENQNINKSQYVYSSISQKIKRTLGSQFAALA